MSLRTSVLNVRTVPIICTSSGMMLKRMPPLIAPTVITAGIAVMSICRLTIVCRPSHDLRGGHDRIDTAPRPRAVRLATLDDDREAVGAGHERTGAIADRPGRQRRDHVQAVHDVRLRDSRTRPARA